MKTEILGIGFDDLSRQEAARRGAELLAEDKFHYVVTPNPEFILAAEKDADFRAVLNGADLVLPDGLRTIGNNAFNDCDNLLYLEIPDTVPRSAIRPSITAIG